MTNLYTVAIIISRALLFFFLVILWYRFESETDTVHSHYNGHILDMMHVLDLLSPEVRQHLLYSNCQQLQTLFVRIGHHEAVHVHHRLLIGFDMLLVVHQHIQKFNRVHRQVHVDVVWILETFGQLVMLFVYFAHRLPCAHVPAQHLRLHFVYFAIHLEILVAVGIQIVRNYK